MSSSTPAREEAKFTKGPWKRSAGRILASDGMEIAAVKRFVPAHAAEAQANLNVMYAAPEMYAALVAMVEAYREGCEDDDEPSMVVAALKAIARAEGR